MKVDQYESLDKEQILVKYTPEKKLLLRYLSWYTSKKTTDSIYDAITTGKNTGNNQHKMNSFKIRYICDYIFLCKRQKNP